VTLAFDQLDYYSLCSVQLNLFFRDTKLSTATGFFKFIDEQLYLVSNWHVFSGRHPKTGQPLHKLGAIPDRIKLTLHGQDFGLVYEDSNLYLDNADGRALWKQHRLGQSIDVAILPINEMPDMIAWHDIVGPDEPDSIYVGPGMDVFVLGYPQGVSNSGILPIWKRGSIATEPAINHNDERLFLIDCATREGMSGAPVIFRTAAVYVGEAEGANIFKQASKFVGVYSGRFGAKELDSVQLGRVWAPSIVTEIIECPCEGTYQLFPN
jgi:hypothetical protein